VVPGYAVLTVKGEEYKPFRILEKPMILNNPGQLKIRANS